jgi:hypothetical protein
MRELSENGYDEFIRLERAIESNKRYLQELNRTVDLKNCDDIYDRLITVQERLLREIAKCIV